MDDLDLNDIPVTLEKTASERDLKERELHQQWVQSGKHPDALVPLLRRYEPFIQQRTQMFAGAKQVDQAATKLQVTQAVVSAFDTFKPNAGASINTHVQNSAKRVLRNVIKAQDIARIPEADALQIGKLDRARSILQDEMGRMPTPQEMAAHTGMTVRKVQNVLKKRVVDLSSGGFEVPVTQASANREREVLGLLKHTLLPKEQQLFELVYEQGIQSTGALAKKMGLTETAVAGLKSSIANKAKQHI